MEFLESLVFLESEWTVVVRLCLAVLCGGLIGMEREHKHRVAGFRTHILVCLGASLTTMTSQYLWTYYNPDWIHAAENALNIIPVMVGVALGAYGMRSTPNAPTLQLAGLFGSSPTGVRTV